MERFWLGFSAFLLCAIALRIVVGVIKWLGRCASYDEQGPRDRWIP